MRVVRQTDTQTHRHALIDCHVKRKIFIGRAFFKILFYFYCVLVRVTVYVGCLSGVINDDDDDYVRSELQQKNQNELGLADSDAF